MANLTTTNLDSGSVIMEGVADHDALITITSATTVLEGTILARDSATLNYVPFVKGGVTNENGIPKAVLTYPITTTGAGNQPARVMQVGKLNFNRLVIDADGDNSNIDNAVRDQMLDYGLEVVNVTDLSILDNQ